MDTPCCICEITYKMRVMQRFFHRQCMPNFISSTENVRMKKYNESFNSRCVKCVGGVIVSAPENLEPQPKRKRGRPVSNDFKYVPIGLVVKVSSSYTGVSSSNP
jgi:hypothetical protein